MDGHCGVAIRTQLFRITKTALSRTAIQTFMGLPAGTVLPPSVSDSTRSGKLWQVYWYEGSTAAPLSSATYKQFAGADANLLKGQRISFDALTFSSSYDSYNSSNSFATMFVKYFDSNWAYLGGESLNLKPNPTNSWISNNMTFNVGTADNIATIQIGFENSQVNWGGGSVYVDNVSISNVPEPSTVSSDSEWRASLPHVSVAVAKNL